MEGKKKRTAATIHYVSDRTKGFAIHDKGVRRFKSWGIILGFWDFFLDFFGFFGFICIGFWDF